MLDYKVKMLKSKRSSIKLSLNSTCLHKIRLLEDSALRDILTTLLREFNNNLKSVKSFLVLLRLPVKMDLKVFLKVDVEKRNLYNLHL